MNKYYVSVIRSMGNRFAEVPKQYRRILIDNMMSFPERFQMVIRTVMHNWIEDEIHGVVKLPENNTMEFSLRNTDVEYELTVPESADYQKEYGTLIEMTSKLGVRARLSSPLNMPCTNQEEFYLLLRRICDNLSKVEDPEVYKFVLSYLVPFKLNGIRYSYILQNPYSEEIINSSNNYIYYLWLLLAGITCKNEKLSPEDIEAVKQIMVLIDNSDSGFVLSTSDGMDEFRLISQLVMMAAQITLSDLAVADYTRDYMEAIERLNQYLQTHKFDLPEETVETRIKPILFGPKVNNESDMIHRVRFMVSQAIPSHYEKNKISYKIPENVIACVVAEHPSIQINYLSYSDLDNGVNGFLIASLGSLDFLLFMIEDDYDRLYGLSMDEDKFGNRDKLVVDITRGYQFTVSKE